MKPFSLTEQAAINLVLHLDDLPDDTLEALIEAIHQERNRRLTIIEPRSRP